MPLCSRCFGFYLGLLLGIPFGLFLLTLPHMGMLPMILVLGAGMGPFFLDGFTQYMGWRESTNGVRLGTGLLAGLTISAVMTELVLYGAGY